MKTLDAAAERLQVICERFMEGRVFKCDNGCIARLDGDDALEAARELVAALRQPAAQGVQCCKRDHDGDGNCDVHSAPGVLRHPPTPPAPPAAEPSEPSPAALRAMDTYKRGLALVHENDALRAKLSQAEAAAGAMEKASRHLLDVLEAHDVDSLDCDRRGDTYCDCLSKAVEKLQAALANAAAATGGSGA